MSVWTPNLTEDQAKPIYPPTPRQISLNFGGTGTHRLTQIYPDVCEVTEDDNLWVFTFNAQTVSGIRIGDVLVIDEGSILETPVPEINCYDRVTGIAGTVVDVDWTAKTISLRTPTPAPRTLTINEDAPVVFWSIPFTRLTLIGRKHPDGANTSVLKIGPSTFNSETPDCVAMTYSIAAGEDVPVSMADPGLDNTLNWLIKTATANDGVTIIIQ